MKFVISFSGNHEALCVDYLHVRSHMGRLLRLSSMDGMMCQRRGERERERKEGFMCEWIDTQGKEKRGTGRSCVYPDCNVPTSMCLACQASG